MPPVVTSAGLRVRLAGEVAVATKFAGTAPGYVSMGQVSAQGSFGCTLLVSRPGVVAVSVVGVESVMAALMTAGVLAKEGVSIYGMMANGSPLWFLPSPSSDRWGMRSSPKPSVLIYAAVVAAVSSLFEVVGERSSQRELVGDESGEVVEMEALDICVGKYCWSTRNENGDSLLTSMVFIDVRTGSPR